MKPCWYPVAIFTGLTVMFTFVAAVLTDVHPQYSPLWILPAASCVAVAIFSAYANSV